MTPRPVVLFICALGLYGCATTGSAPEDHYYRLPPPLPAVNVEPLVSGAVSVEKFRSTGLHGQRPIVHTGDTSGIELLQYHYHYWIDSPTRLVADFLTSYLRVSGAAGLVVDGADAGTDLHISGRITGFERITGGGAGAVLVALEIRVDRDDGLLPLLLREYREEVEVDGEAMDRTVMAFATALNSICSTLVRDIEAALAQ